MLIQTPSRQTAALGIKRTQMCFSETAAITVYGPWRLYFRVQCRLRNLMFLVAILLVELIDSMTYNRANLQGVQSTMKAITRSIVSSILLFCAFTSQAALLTSQGDIPSPTLIDFSTQPTVSGVSGPIQIGDAVAMDVTVDGVPNSGFYTNYSNWGLCENGNWGAPQTYISANDARPGMIRVAFNDGPVSAVGGFMNHAPCESATLIISAYDAGMNLLESYDITADAVTPGGFNAGVFRGISRPSADIAYFTIFGGVPVLDDVTFTSGVVLLGVNSGAGGQFLASIDVDTAALTNLGNTGLTIDGIAMGNGILYAADNGNSRLVTLDPESGALDTVIGNFVNIATAEAMAFRTSDGALFGIDLGGGNLVSFDTSTGEATVVGPLGTAENLAGLSFSGDGTLYSIAHSSGNLFTINPATGAATLVAAGTGNGPLGLAVHPFSDVFYTASWKGGSDMLLETVDPATAVRTLVGTLVGGQQIEGLTFWTGSVDVPLADLTISKTDGVDPVTAGTELTYTIHVENVGPAPAENVVVTDTLPAGVTLVSTTGCAEDPSGVPDCSLGTIASGGSVDYTVTVMVGPSLTGQITNQVSVATSSTESDTTNNSATQDTAVVAVADLSITKMDSSDPIISGGNQVLVYTIEVSNAGPSDATNVLVTDTLPAVAVFQSTTGCQNDPLGVPVCQLGTIAAGASASYTITVSLQRSGGTISNTVSVASDASDPTGNNDSVSETTEVIPIPIPALNNFGLLLLILLLTGFAWAGIRRN